MIGLEFHGPARHSIVVSLTDEDLARFENGFVGKIVLCTGKPIHFQRVPRASHEDSCGGGDHVCIRLGAESLARLRAGRVATIPIEDLVVTLARCSTDDEALSMARGWARKLGVPLHVRVQPSVGGLPS